MCTLSFFRNPAGGYFIYMNRDERHDRPKALAPQALSPLNKIYGPLDPPSGGTWIAHNDEGYWGCLLNGYFDEETMPTPAKSRGDILLELLKLKDPLSAIADFDPTPYASFRLIIGSPTKHTLWVWNRKDYRPEAFHAEHQNRAFFISSSSWNQDEVIQHRVSLFKDYVQSGSKGESLPNFHRSQEPNQQSATMMYRSYSATQSITQLTVTQDSTSMEYQPIFMSARPEEEQSEKLN